METGERLAAYLAGELDVDAARALEAELARDERLRARLASIRATDEALAGLAPVEPPADFSARLRDTIAAELDRQLPADGDELAARRGRTARRGTAATRTWWPQVAVAAAVLAIAGIGLSQLGGGDAGGPEAALETAEDSAMGMTTTEAAAGPTVVAAGRSFDTESLRELADDARFDELVDQGLAGAAAADTANEFDAAIQGDVPADGGARLEAETEAAAESAPAESAPAESAPAESVPAPDIGLRTVGDVSEEDLADVRACLPSLLEAQTAVIPVYVELVTFEGQDAIVYGLVGNDPAAETYSRVELWVVGRGDCQVVHFTQVDR